MFYTDFPAGWYLMFFVGLGVWLIFLFLVRDRKFKNTVKRNIVFGFIALGVGILVEIIGIGTGLWNYTTGNWPIILWPCYFVYGMASYAVFRFIEKDR